MKAQELRIGNKLQLAKIGVVELAGLDRLDNGHIPVVANDAKEWFVSFAVLAPIPLTEEWLLKFGFEKGPIYHSFNGFDIDNRGWFGYNDMVAKVPLNYVHQLQNLYFALTGQELVLSPTN